ncbi:MAG TPA: DUF3592 domain-containing protein [Myxococcota bacterium]|nr:DUF3592 domain-containing protein [Myxococcota bacterium]HRY95766.1 DUF3592 domain-containing protein [Myxococcota bacterium]HSA20537.1 DUF3592 domain-containing protein [Myxococcota bacterium]
MHIGPLLAGGRLPPGHDLPTDRRFMYAATLAMLFGGLAAFVYGVQGWAATYEVRGWPATEGEVQEAWREVERRGDHHITKLYVTYTYRVAGREHRGQRVDAASEFVAQPGGAAYHVVSDSEADELLARYREGRTVRVYYDPEDPQRSLLTKGLGYWHDIAMWAGLPLAALGFFLVRWLRRTEPEDEEPPGQGSLNAS